LGKKLYLDDLGVLEKEEIEDTDLKV